FPVIQEEIPEINPKVETFDFVASASNVPPLVVTCKTSTGQCLRILLDSGSQISIIHDRFKNLLTNFEVNHSNIITVNGERVSLSGEGQIQINILGENILVKTVVMKNVQFDMLIGLDILYDKPYLIQKAIEFVKSEKDKDFFSIFMPDSHLSFLRLDQEIRIPPRAVCFAKFKCKDDMSGTLLISPLADDPDYKVKFDLDFVVPRCVVEIKDNEFSVPVHNFNFYEYCLPAGLKIGFVQPFDQAVVAANKVNGSHWIADDWLAHVQDLDPRVRSILENYRIRINQGNYNENLPKMFIDTGDTNPVSSKPYRTTLENRKVIDSEIIRLKKLGYLRESFSAWSSPVIIVYKRDASGKVNKSKPRLVADYRLLNSHSKSVVEFIPNTVEILEQLSGASLYSSIDLKEAYHQIK
ncbi:MAG TPA: retropepsin-like aspartic protease, partial [Aquella sp.]|nr:retropepsin-like aspartic protease [Aquella sp.]